jgi:hypothetical protein
MPEYPDNNPKTLIGAKKVPLHLVPPSATHYFAMAMSDGANKYGPYNWRDKAVSVSTYIAAAKRHMDAYWDGEDCAADSGVHHLAHAMACMGIVIDAMTIGKLVDDRPAKGAAPRLQADYNNKEVLKNGTTEGTGSRHPKAEEATVDSHRYPLVLGRVPYNEEDVRAEAGRE